MMHEIHNIPPIYSKDSKILVLGSFPSKRSRTDEFFYAHPRNRFWHVISAVCGESEPITTKEKRSLLLRNGIAL